MPALPAKALAEIPKFVAKYSNSQLGPLRILILPGGGFVQRLGRGSDGRNGEQR